MGRSITKSAVTAGRACELRAFRTLSNGEWGTAPLPPPPPPLVRYRARHSALASVHRLRLSRGVVDEASLSLVWAQAWRSAGGTSEPPEDGLAWLQAYVIDDPFLHMGTGRVAVAVERTLRAQYTGRMWQARPDLLVRAPDGALEALELSSARSPLLDRSQVETMVAINLLVMAGLDMPDALRQLPHRVIICALDDYREIDVSMDRVAARKILGNIASWLDGLSPDTRPSPSLDTCSGCGFRDTCAFALTADPATTESTVVDVSVAF